MKANLLVPFGMLSSGYLWSNAFEAHAARPHDSEGKPLPKARPTATDAARYASAGGLHTTPADFVKFLVEVIDAGRGDGFRLRKDTRDEMVRPHVKVDESSSWALGWQIRHTRKGDLVQHQGDQKGFQSFTAASIPRRRGFIVMTNSDNGWKVVDQVYREITDRFLAD